ncbi:hypothetical protein F3R34_18835 [Salmonella enterica subsp. enterica]|nr:hypothetical protein [Salmonella enterica subsp. enterica]
MKNNIFLSEALKFRESKQTISPVIVPPIKKGVIIGAAACFGMIILILSLNYTERLPVKGVVMPEGGVISVKTDSGGTISDIDISSGDYVHKNQMLFAVQTGKEGENGLEEAEVNKDALRYQQKILLDSYQSQYRSMQSEVKSVNETLVNKRSSLQILAEKKSVFENELARETPFYERIMKLSPGGAISEKEKNNIAASYFSLKLQLLNNRKSINEEERSILEFVQKKDNLITSIAREKMKFEKENNDITRQINDISIENKYFVHSPVEGYISGLSKGNGDGVSERENVASISINNTSRQPYCRLCFFEQYGNTQGFPWEYSSYKV